MTRRKVAILVVFSLIVGGYFGWWLRQQSDIDACLDAGGRWETNGSYCDGVEFLPTQ